MRFEQNHQGTIRFCDVTARETLLLDCGTRWAGEFGLRNPLGRRTALGRKDLWYPLGRRGTITLQRQSWQLPESVPFDGSQLIPLGAGTSLNWKLSL